MAGFELEAKIEGLDDLKIKLNDSPSRLDYIENQVLKMAAMIFQAEAKMKAPVDKTNLRKSIQYEIKGTPGSRFAIVGTNIPYAKYQEEGTGIYGKYATPVVPKRAKFLVFRGKDGNLVFARQVRGVQGKRYWLAGLQKLQGDMGKVLEYGKKLVGDLLK